MLTTLQVILNSVVCLLFPLVLHSLATGSPAPTGGPLAKFYAAERHLNLCGNLFLLALCAVAIGNLGLHFGYIDMGLADRVELVTTVPFMTLFFAYLAFWISAAIKVRRMSKSGA